MGRRQLEMKSYGKVKVKRNRPDKADIPDNCGYMKQFKYNIDMNTNGINGECIDWCQENCKGKWGWWFEQKDLYNPLLHNWEEQNAYMSFEKEAEASKFWISVGVVNMGKQD